MILRLYHKFRSESTHNILTFEIARDFFTEDVSCFDFYDVLLFLLPINIRSFQKYDAFCIVDVQLYSICSMAVPLLTREIWRKIEQMFLTTEKN